MAIHPGCITIVADSTRLPICLDNFNWHSMIIIKLWDKTMAIVETYNSKLTMTAEYRPGLYEIHHVG